jgi:TolB-like protein/cytochrome c-type biogenesis protein CcmH/NrfG
VKPSLFAELRRRNVFRAGALYIGAAWALSQGVAQLLPVFNFPNWVVRWFVIAAMIGFPFAMLFSWFYEWTPQGMQRESDVEQDASITRETGKKLDRWIIAVLSLAVVLLLANTFVLHKDENAAAAARAPEKSIAVLPFENLSADRDNAYFANGMQDMILTKLAAIGELKVISRTSTEKYTSHPDNLKAIALQLGVVTILEGSVQKSGNTVLINVQLIDAGTDVHLWADAYPRTLDNIFGVEGEVAQKVADALKAKLTPAESASVATLQTRNAAAFDLFLKAEEEAYLANGSWQESSFATTDDYYRQAIALDPDFALALANRAYYRMDRHWLSRKLTDAELADVKAAIDRALALKPDLPQAHLALGYYHYWGFRHYEDANAEFQQTLKFAPNNVLALEGLAFIARRTGQFPQALAYFESALAVAPRDADTIGEFGVTLAMLRRYAEADRQMSLALSIDPNDVAPRNQLIATRLFGFGDVAGARRADDPSPFWQTGGPDAFTGDVLTLVNPRVYPDVVARRFDAALQGLDGAPTATALERLDTASSRIAIRIIAGQRQMAQPECTDIAPQLQAELVRQPGSLRRNQQLAWVELCLGHDAAAIQAARQSVELLPVEKDTFWGPYQLVGLTQIDAQAHAPDEALQLIARLLAMPAGTVMSVQRLKLDPVWDPLRKDPRFQKLIADNEAAQSQVKP